MKNKVILLAAGLSIFITLKSCVNHEFSEVTATINTAESLFKEVMGPGYQYYQNGSILSPSPHLSFRLRFNAIAWASLNNSGELPLEGKFKDGSVIVKEAYNGNSLNQYAVMKKAPSDANSGNGWIWTEYSLDGVPLISIEEKGSRCIGCHSETPNRDLVRTFDLH